MRKLVMLMVVTSCQSAPPAAPPAVPLPPAPTPPSGPPPEVPALDLAEPKAPFEPGVYGTGRAPNLRDALQGKEKFVLVCSPGLRATDDEKRVIDMIRAMVPKARILARGQDTLRALQIERGERPAELRKEATGETDIFGWPTYVFKDVLLQTEWLGKAKKMYGAEVLIWIDIARLDPERRNRFRRLTVGGCGDLLAELDGMRASAAEAVGPFVDHVNGMLLARFQEMVRPQASAWMEALRPWSEPPGDRLSYDREEEYYRHQCGHAYSRIIDDAVRCREAGACAEVPAVMVRGGAWIGASRSTIYVANDCPQRIGTDYIGKLREAAAAAGRDVLDEMPAESGVRVAAAGALDSLRESVKEACAPARGRVPEENRALAAAKMKEAIAALRDAAAGPGDAWIEERVERNGAMQSARFRSSSMDAVEREVGEAVRGARDRHCRSTLDDPMAVVAIEVATSEILFFDYFREEEILCDGMAPVGLTP